MRFKFILFLLLTLKSVSVFSQENTDYWYDGVAYTDSTELTSGVPYLTIVLSKEFETVTALGIWSPSLDNTIVR